MGWLPQIKAPNKYDAKWMQNFIEQTRTAINFPKYDVSGTFTSADGKVITVKNGMVVSIK